MFEQSLLKLFVLLFAFLTWYRFRYSVFFLFLLLPTYLIRFKIFTIPGTLLEEMLFIILLIWVGKIWIKNDFKNKFFELNNIIREHKTLVYASILFLLGATISVFTSIDMRSALGEWKAFYIEPFILFIFLILYIKEKKQVYDILFAIVLGGLITSLLAIYQHFTGWMVPWEFWENANSYRVTGWYGFPNGVGLFLAPIFPLAIYLFKNNWKKNNILSIISILYILLSPFAVFFAKSTGGFVGMLAGIGILLILWEKTRKPAFLIGILCAVLLILIPTNPVKQELLMQDRSGQLRINMWAETMEFLSDHPITGAGLASYKTLIYPYRIDKWVEVFHHPHNIFLTMWVNLGLLGLLGFTWITVWFYRVGLQNLPQYQIRRLADRYGARQAPKNLQATSYKLQPYLLASMATLLTTGLVDSPYIKNDMAILFWLIISLMVINLNNKNRA